MRLALLALALAATAACSDPTIAIELRYPEEPLARRIADAGVAHALTVSVLDAETIGRKLRGEGQVAHCDDLEWGDVPADVIDGARRTVATVGGDDTAIAGVPRLGEKLIFVEDREAGHLVAAGCTEQSDVDADTDVAVDVMIVPHVHEFLRPGDPDVVTTANIIATAHWDDDVGVVGRAARYELFGVDGQQFEAEGTTGDRGRIKLECPPATCGATGFRLPNGPLVKVVRVQWGEAPARIAAFNPFAIIPGSPIAVALGATPPSSWITGVITFPDGHDGWAALGVHPAADGTTEGAVVYMGMQGLARADYPADGAGAIAIWAKTVWTVSADGWHPLRPTGLGPRAGGLDSAGPAREIVAITDCAMRPPLGLLVRRAAEPYAPFIEPGTAATDEPAPAIAILAGVIGTDSVIGQLCANSTPGGMASETTDVEKLVAVQGPSGIRMIRIIGGQVSSDRVFPLPQVAAVTRFDTGANAGLAGAVITQTGFRVVSFRFASFGPTTDVAVQTTRLDRPIAVQPSSIAVVNLDGDELGDVVAALPTTDGPRVQVVMGTDVAGEPLAAAGPPIDAVSVDARPRLVLENVVGSDDCLEMVILTERVDVVDTHLHGPGSPCATDQLTPP